MTISTNRESDRFIVRLPDGMRDRIKLVAAENNRSMNAEIVATLEEKYPAPIEPEIDFGLEAVVARSEELIAQMKSLVANTKSGGISFDEADEVFARLTAEHAALFRDHEAKIVARYRT